MKLRQTLLAVVVCVGTVAGVSAPLTVSAQPTIYFNVAPPPPRHEVIPGPRHGYVWHSGYWDLRGNRHVWRPGHWERVRRGYYLDQPAWVQNGDRWELRRGRWSRGDNDHDGVRNRDDRAPNNPHVN